MLGCTRSDSQENDGERLPSENEIRIVLKADPPGLNPILSTHSLSRYVSQQIFQTLNAKDPETFELRPCLASLPEVDTLPTGGLSYRYHLDTAARWPNNEPVRVSDVIFSLKAMLNLRVNAGPYRSYYSMISDIVPEEESGCFRVLTKEPYLLAAEAIGDLYIYPEYAYDPAGDLRSVSLSELTDSATAKRLEKESKPLLRFADRFNDRRTSTDPDRIVGSGPYRLTGWESGSKVRLERRPDYWASGRSEPWLMAIPEVLTFLIITDNTATANALRSNLADVVVDMPVEQFKDLRKEEFLQQRYDFITVPSFKYFNILLNQDDPLLADSLTRRALAHSVNVDKILSNLLPNLAERVIGPVLPTKEYYNRELPPIPYDLAKARELLRKAGWEDTDGDNVLEKVIDGERRDLRFDLLSFPTPTSEAVSIVTAQGAKKVGFDIRVVLQDPHKVMNRLNGGEYVASFYGQGFEPTPDDFSQLWSSTSIPPAGSNRGNFQNFEADSLIDRIALTTDGAERVPLYRRFQEIVYDNQPMIFLYSPYDRLVVSKRLQYQVSSLAPNLNFNALAVVPSDGPPTL
ncbi:ABC transporter substrate-binding protein [Lewinella sp. IMCC34183]|uniref:ABC transporter substrate-binding protein n=1 Tax=Lewinella sp. IMCC34183 TaxID=2248762 RepID=UPI001300A9A9|nr:ABC transporter substrate-binding protein [Lewinella sp. IMCC34183]